ncbi:hypothetical protein Pta02_10790 [Planobispora takensis]|uniref:Uncharacterized protein n=1 Tax=Planobispora takensis TaxID=1367882 RepID=A0A8J3SUN4_9ACTN|nr:hypothetical protein Pta02_10790 [Planobispora takensis]
MRVRVPPGALMSLHRKSALTSGDMKADRLFWPGRADPPPGRPRLSGVGAGPGKRWLPNCDGPFPGLRCASGEMVAVVEELREAVYRSVRQVENREIP